MASVIIHLAVAKKVNEVLKRNQNELFLGAMAPDAAKLVGSSRKISHFITNPNSDTPELNIFLDKYQEDLDDTFVLGYFIHLVTDVLWFDEFLVNFVNENVITTKTGEKLVLEDQDVLDIIYNDFTSMNQEVEKYYNLNLDEFYTLPTLPKSRIKEFPEDYFYEVINKIKLINEKKVNYSYLFNINKIVPFIEYASTHSLDEIKRIGKTTL